MSMKEDIVDKQERLKGGEDEAGGGVFTSNTEDKEK